MTGTLFPPKCVVGAKPSSPRGASSPLGTATSTKISSGIRNHCARKRVWRHAVHEHVVLARVRSLRLQTLALGVGERSSRTTATRSCRRGTRIGSIADWAAGFSTTTTGKKYFRRAYVDLYFQEEIATWIVKPEMARRAVIALQKLADHQDNCVSTDAFVVDDSQLVRSPLETSSRRFEARQ